jgi:hypothetical protein
MASRAVWKGHMRLSLVSIPIEIHPASQSAASISFVQIHAPSGQRVRHVKSVPGIGAIETSDIVKGYELGENQYMLIKPEEVDDIKLETSKSFDLVQFVGRERSRRFTTRSRTTSFPPILWGSRRTASSATHCVPRTSPASARSRCAARSISAPSQPTATASSSRR